VRCLTVRAGAPPPRPPTRRGARPGHRRRWACPSRSSVRVTGR
jgi:hypothetical protein